MRTAAAGAGAVRVWDPLVRTFHWALVLVCAVAWATAQTSENAHEIAGYVAIALVFSRVVWGLVGARYARFSEFVRAPRVVLIYLREILAGAEARFIGHNPAGGAMIVALLADVGAISVSGWLLTTDALWGVAWAQRMHSLLAHGLVFLIALHVAGVALASWRHRENLPLAMITGVKRVPHSD